ncbi:1,2-epoxyphenylacetyl-CoA isomerase [compost metagenome]
MQPHPNWKPLMSSQPISLQPGVITHIRFNRPEALNAIDSAMARAFLDACRATVADPGVRVIVLSGEGRAFMAGGDITQFKNAPQSIADELIQPLNEAMLLLANCAAPVIASVRGAAAGAGMSIVLASDFALASANSRFNFAYLSLGASCDLGASWHLPRLVGLRRALHIALLGEPLDAEHACRLGIVNQVVAVEELESATQALAERLAQSSPVAQGHLKRLLRQAFDNTQAEQLDAEKAAFAACAQGEDFQEAVSAFLQKRPAQFKGR